MGHLNGPTYSFQIIKSKVLLNCRQNVAIVLKRRHYPLFFHFSSVNMFDPRQILFDFPRIPQFPRSPPSSPIPPQFSDPVNISLCEFDPRQILECKVVLIAPTCNFFIAMCDYVSKPTFFKNVRRLKHFKWSLIFVKPIILLDLLDLVVFVVPKLCISSVKLS